MAKDVDEALSKMKDGMNDMACAINDAFKINDTKPVENDLYISIKKHIAEVQELLKNI